MANAAIDDNRTKTLLGVSSTDGETPLKAEITATTGRLRVDTLITGDDATTTDVDDDNIAKAQSLPLIINENYIFDKTGDNWNRMQGSTDGYQFVRPIGIYNSAGNELDITAGGDLKTIITDGTDDADVVTNAATTDNLDGTKGLVTASVIYGRLSDTTVRPVDVDDSTHALTTIDYPHHEIHSGSYYCAFHNASGKNDGTTINIYMKTPAATKYVHIFTEWSTSGSAYFNIREAPTVTANSGTNGNVPMNHNRNLIANASGVFDNATTPVVNRYGKDVTVTAPGTLIHQEYAGTGRTSGGANRNSDEFILLANTAYVFEVESDAAGLTLSMVCKYYEHTDKN